MQISEPVGVPGAPLETLEALSAALEGLGALAAPPRVLLLTDGQGQREHARYAVLLRHPQGSVLSREAFGPHYGPAGIQGLDTLVRRLLERGLNDFKEVVVMPTDFGRLMQEPDGNTLEKLLSSANPVDPNVYLMQGLIDVPFAPSSSPLE